MRNQIPRTDPYRPLSIVSVTDSPVLLNDKYQLFVTIPERKPYRIPKNCDCRTFRVAVLLPCQIEKVKMRQKILLLVILIATGFAANAQRLTIGGYGEAMMTRNFYSDAWQRYNHPEQYKDDKSHGRFDIPHFVINLGYDFGKDGRSARRSSSSTEAPKARSSSRLTRQVNMRARSSAEARSLWSSSGSRRLSVTRSRSGQE